MTGNIHYAVWKCKRRGEKEIAKNIIKKGVVLTQAKKRVK